MAAAIIQLERNHFRLFQPLRGKKRQGSGETAQLDPQGATGRGRWRCLTATSAVQLVESVCRPDLTPSSCTFQSFSVVLWPTALAQFTDSQHRLRNDRNDQHRRRVVCVGKKTKKLLSLVSGAVKPCFEVAGFQGFEAEVTKNDTVWVT